MVEADLERAEERAELGEKYVFQIQSNKLQSIIAVFRVCVHFFKLISN